MLTMIDFRNKIILHGIFISIILVFCIPLPALGLGISDGLRVEEESGSVYGSCTIFTVSLGDTVLFGNNEDGDLTGTYIWMSPAQEIETSLGTITTYGAIALGYNYNDHGADGYAQGGMNDQGLCADGNALPRGSLNPHPERESPFTYLIEQVLWTCSTINETIEWFESHNMGSQWSCQIHFADASGDAMVASVLDGEFTYTRKGSANFLVSTNFNLANTSNAFAYPCWRHDTATSMLEEITSEGELTVEAVRNVLDAVHEEGEFGTKYSNIFDLVNRDVYLYHDHNFEKVVRFDLNEELDKIEPGGEGVKEEEGLIYKEISFASIFEETSPEPEPEEEPDNQGGIPGFDNLSIIIGLSMSVAMLWLMRIRKMSSSLSN
jgi:hypothetical protein